MIPITNQPTLKILRQNNNRVTFNSNYSLNLGELVLANEEVTGIVTNKVSEEYTAIFYKNVIVKDLRVKNWWSPVQGKTILLTDKQFFIGDIPGLLLVYSSVPNGYVAGSIGWDLEYKDKNRDTYSTVIVGSDWRTPTICSFESSGYWPEGNYILTATRFNPNGYSKISSSSISWTVNSAIPNLQSDLLLNLY
jgi:hypothetical protein